MRMKKTTENLSPQEVQPTLPPDNISVVDSRLKQHVKKQTIRNVLLSIGGLTLLGGIIAVFGTQLLINYSLLLGNSQENKVVTDVNSPSYIAPPVLDPIENATKSATVTITGYTANANQTVNFYVNGKAAGSTKTKHNKSFSKKITLKSGENEIKAKTITPSKKQSDYSNTIKISYATKAPELEITSPQDGQTFKKDASPIRISGKSDDGVRVTVNDFWAISEDDGTFSYSYILKDGENKLKIVATDEADNKTEKEITIKVE